MRLLYTDDVLPSGLRVIVEEARGTGHAEAVLVIDAGASKDPADRLGLAHLVEHLALVRSRVNGLSFEDRALLAGAATTDGSTAPDHVVYSATAPIARLDDLVQLQAGLLTKPLGDLDPKELAVERSVLMAERQYERYPVRPIEKLQQYLFADGQPYSRSFIGRPEHYEKFSVDDARAFVAAEYRPEAATLLVIGDFEATEGKRQVMAALPAELQRPGRPRPKPTPVEAELAPPPAWGVPKLPYSVTKPVLWVAWSAPYEPSADWLRDEFCDRIRDLLPDGTCFTLLSGEVVINSVVLFRDPQFTPEAQLAQVTQRVEMMIGSLPGRKHWQIRQEVLHSAENWLERGVHRAEIAQVTGNAHLYASFQASEDRQAELERAAFKWFTADRARALEVLPGEAHEPFPMEHPVVWDGGVAGLPADASVAPPMFEGVTDEWLANGLEVVVVPRPGVPRISVSLATPGGTMNSTPGVPALLGGLEQHLPLTAGGAGTESRWKTPVASGIAFSAESDALTYAINDAAGYALATWDETGLARERVRAERDFEKTRSGLIWATRGVMAGARPTIEELDAVTLPQAEAWRVLQLRPDRSKLVIAGDVDTRAALQLAKQAFGVWKAPAEAPATAPVLPLPPPAKRGATLVHKPTELMATLDLHCLTESKPGDEEAALVVEQLLRLEVKGIRTRFGTGYATAHLFDRLPGLSHLEHQTIVHPKLVEPALRTIERALDAEPGPAQLRRAGLMAQQRAHLELAEPTSELALDLSEDLVVAGSLHALSAQRASIAAVSDEEVKKAWRQCANTATWTVTGNAADIRSSVTRVLGPLTDTGEAAPTPH